MTKETTRIEAFSDGIFSIAATLLVLELKLPPPSTPFWAGLWQQWPGFLSFLLSFFLIGIMWLNHHRLFSILRGADDFLMIANLLLLLAVVWIPYPTAIMAQAVAGGRLMDAAILYNGSYLAVAVFFNVLYLTCGFRGLLMCSLVRARSTGKQYAFGILMYAVTFAITWWNVTLSLVLNAAIALFFLFAPKGGDEVVR